MVYHQSIDNAHCERYNSLRRQQREGVVDAVEVEGSAHKR